MRVNEMVVLVCLSSSYILIAGAIVVVIVW